MHAIEQFGLVLSGTWYDGRRNALTGSDPEKVSNVQKTSPKSCKRDQEGVLKKVMLT